MVWRHSLVYSDSTVEIFGWLADPTFDMRLYCVLTSQVVPEVMTEEDTFDKFGRLL